MATIAVDAETRELLIGGVMEIALPTVEISAPENIARALNALGSGPIEIDEFAVRAIVESELYRIKDEVHGLAEEDGPSSDDVRAVANRLARCADVLSEAGL